MPNAPEWVANLTLGYTLPIGQNGEIFAFTDWAWRSEVDFLLYESREFRSDDMLEGGLRVGYSHDGGKWEIAAFGRNITDEDNVIGFIDFNNNTGFVNEPRVWGIEVGYEFGD